MSTAAQPEMSNEEISLLKIISDQLTTFSGMRIDDLVQEARLGSSFGFVAQKGLFKKALALVEQLRGADLSLVSVPKLHVINGLLSRGQQVFANVRGFNPSVPNPYAAHDTAAANVQEFYDKLFDETGLILAHGKRSDTALAELRSEGQAIITEMRSLLESQIRMRAEQENSLLNVEQTLDRVRRAAEEVGVVQHAIHFQREAREHQVAARWWLGVTGAFAILTLLLASWSFNLASKLITEPPVAGQGSPAPPLESVHLVQFAIAKLIVFSLLISATVWSGRVYRSHRHNYVINKHRQNALSTFEAFAKAAENDLATKNAVLLQATECIFSPQPTGYISAETETEGVPKVLEIVRDFSGKGSK